jgi:uncharacterized membrane protein
MMITRWIKTISAPERFLLLMLLFFGGIACFAIPLSAGYDEETHFVRAWEMAHLYFVPNEQLGAKLPFPALYWEVSYRRQPIVEAVEPGLWSKYGSLRMDAHDYIYSNVVTRSVYSPVLLLPQALMLRYLGLSLQLPALAVYYSCRLVGLLSYLILCWLALHSIPFGKWLLAVLMVSPMALFQASSISADTISNGIGFLFLGASLGLATKGQLSWKHWWLLLVLIALLFTAKVNLLFLVLLPFLLIRPSRFRMKYGYALLIVAAILLFVVEVAGWNVVAYSHFTRMLEGASPTDQARYILSAPLQFIAILARDILTNGLAYLQGWVGVYGYNYWPVPSLTYVLYLMAVVAAWIISNQEAASAGPNSLIAQRWTRIVLIGLFVAGLLLTIASLYIAFTPVGSQLVAGVQGRYFTPVVPLILLGLLGMRPRTGDSYVRSSHQVSPAVAAGFAAAALVLYTGGLILSYHVPCGSEYYQLGLCYQPQYKNWAPEAASSPPVSPSMTLAQEIVPACNGMQQVLVWVNSPGSDPSGTANFILRDPRQGTDLVRQTFRNAEIPEDGWVRLNFAPQPSSKDNLYVLKVAGSSPGGIQVGYSLKAEYMKGKLSENGRPVSQDMLFQYGCLTGLQKAIEGWGAQR